MVEHWQIEWLNRIDAMTGMDREIVVAYLKGKPYGKIAAEFNYHKGYVKQVCEPYKRLRLHFDPDAIREQIHNRISDIISPK